MIDGMRLIAPVYIYRRHGGSTFRERPAHCRGQPGQLPEDRAARGRRGSASGWCGPRIAGASARRGAAELLQLGLDQCGELVDLRQRVRVGVAAEEELLAVADHADRERVALGDRDDGVDLFELASQ